MYQVSNSELEILQIIWAHGGTIMLSTLMEDLSEDDRHWKRNTVLTFLARLSDKGLVTAEKSGRFNAYKTLISQQEYLDQQTRTFVSNVYGGDAKGLIASLLKQEGMKPDDVSELRSYWEEGLKDE